MSTDFNLCEAILDSMNELVSVYNTSLDVVWVNKAIKKYLNLPEDKITGIKCHHLWHNQPKPCTTCPVIKVKKTKKPESAIIQSYNKYWSLRVYPMLKDGEIIAFIEYAEDITEKFLIEESTKKALIESREKEMEIQAFLSAARAIPISNNFIDAARVIFQNCLELTGATAGYVALLTPDGNENEVLFLDPGGLPCSVDPNLPMPIRGLREIAFKEGRAVYENNFRNSPHAKYMPPGHAELHNVLFSPLKFGKKLVGLIGIANKPGGFNQKDTERAETFGEIAAVALKYSRNLENIKESEEKFRTIVDTVPQMISYVDQNFVYRFVNKRYEKYFNINRNQIIGKHIQDIIGKKAFDQASGHLRKVSNGEHVRYYEVFEYPGGKKHIDGNLIPDLTDTGEMKGYWAVLTDITPYKLAEEARQESEQKYQKLVDDAPVGIGISKNGIIRYANKRLLDYLGLEKHHEIKDRHITEFMPEDDKLRFTKLIENRKKNDMSFTLKGEHRVIRPTGEQRLLNYTATRFTVNGETLVQGIFTDITEIRNLEKSKRKMLNDAMYINMKNDFFNQIVSQIKNLTRKTILSKNELEDVSRNIKLNLHSEKDWKRLKSVFEEVHKDFFTNLTSKYPHLTQNDLRMCAFIRMDFSTKEIARFLNIKDTSVQISRVRIKKKLGLSRETDLYAFIHQV